MQAELGGTEQVWTNRRARARVSVSQLPGDADMAVLAGATVALMTPKVRLWRENGVIVKVSAEMNDGKVSDAVRRLP